METDILNKNKLFSKNNNLETKKKFSKFSISYSRNNYLNNEEMKDFRKIKESKNKDKILKIHCQQPLVKCLNEFNQLMNHTNRLFVYKSKIAPRDTKKNNLPIVLKKNKDNISKKSKSVDLKVEKSKVLKEKDLSLNIVNRLSNLVKDLENQKFKAKKEMETGFIKKKLRTLIIIHN